jgi:glycyl-tRNA synthetase beta chain
MSARPLLIELFTEELPPKALRRLGEAFATAIVEGLRSRGLAAPAAEHRAFCSPRRLAVRVEGVLHEAPARRVEVKGPSVKVALDAQGQPTQALLKWAQKVGADPAALTRASDGKQECFFHASEQLGETLAGCVDALIAHALGRLPIPKVMEYQLADGRTSVSFVRPAHRLVVLHGDQVVPASVLGLSAGRVTFGHRFQSAGELSIPDASAWAHVLERQGRVIPDFDTRRARILALLQAQAKALGASMGEAAQVESLLEEVTALVEWPAVYVGGFEAEFLQVPQECLILTMRTNQKYFPLFDEGGRLLPKFLIVSNMAIDDPSLIVDGNERVVRPRLADARFFYQQDRRTPLADRVPALGSVVYHAKLGTQAQRMARVQRIAGAIAARLGADVTHAERAALLAKTDLLTGMVGEFPELQGVMGAYYARHDGEAPEVAQAIVEHYQPRFAGDALPASTTGTVLALADKLETLAGLFGIGQQPTGDRDPFALRRHALGVIRMLIERELALPLSWLLDTAFAAFEPAAAAGRPALAEFILERLSGWLRDRGHSPQEVAAVIDQQPDDLARVPQRLAAVRAFSALPQAQSLAAANKRIGNLLRKSGEATTAGLQTSLLTDPAEQALADELAALAPEVDRLMAAHDYTGALTAMARSREAVDRFFEQVMVMAEDPAVRANRLCLLAGLHALMNRVADISRLSA